MDAATQQELLKDPRVQQSIKNAGKNALEDPEVQKQIISACKEKFPEYAGQVAGQVKEWANDPVVQARAREYTGIAWSYAKTAGDRLMDQIEQGPAGVRVLAFIASLASCCNAILALLNVFSVFGHIILYMVAFYQFTFAFTTMIFEAKPEWVQTVQEKCPCLKVNTYQNVLLENAKFLSLTGGRGMFYIFQGTLWLAFGSFAEILDLLIGLFLVFVGMLHVLMHYGIMPQQVAAKMREGYSHLSSPSNSGSKVP